MRDLKQSMQDTMQGDSALQTLLGSPSGDPMKIFYLEPTEKIPLPYIVFWVATGDTDLSYDRNILAQVVEVNIAAWVSQNRGPGDAEHEEILDRVRALFHQRTYNDTDDSAFRSMLSQVQPDLYDKDGNAWGRVAIFTVHLWRTNVL